MASRISTLRFETLSVHCGSTSKSLVCVSTGAGMASFTGAVGGVAHFGFRLVDPNDIDRAITEVERAGGRLLRRGEFAPGLPYAYVADPDGYEIEIWFE